MRMIIGTAGAVLALTAGCSGTPTTTAASSDASDSSAKATSWVDKVCTAMKAVQTAGGTQPKIDQSNPTSTVGGLENYFGGVATAVAGAQTMLQQAGPSPVANADADVTRIEGELSQVQTAFESAHDKIKTVDPANPNALATGLTAALAPVQNLNVTTDAIGEFRKNPNFDAVAKGVPSCNAT